MPSDKSEPTVFTDERFTDERFTDERFTDMTATSLISSDNEQSRSKQVQ